MSKITLNKFKEALKNSGGVQSVIAKRMGVSRSAVTQYINNHPEIKKELQQEDDAIDDLAEYKLYELINNGEFQAIKYRLSTKGKNRGYVEKQEIVHSGIEPFKIIIETKEDDREKNKTD